MPFETPPCPRNFQSLLWQKYGHFLEPHTAWFQIASIVTVTPTKAIEKSWRDDLSNYNAKLERFTKGFTATVCSMSSVSFCQLQNFCYTNLYFLDLFAELNETEWKLCKWLETYTYSKIILWLGHRENRSVQFNFHPFYF